MQQLNSKISRTNKTSELLNFRGLWDLSPAPEDTSHVNIKKQYELFIKGKWQKPKSGKHFDTINPANEKTITSVANGGKEDVDDAMKAARNAFNNTWSKMPAIERSKYIYRVARMIQEKSRELAIIESMDNGKVIRETRTSDIPLSAAYFFYYAGWADKLDYAFPNRKPQPLGVAAQIIPWNFPFLIASWTISAALGAGNTIVIKPSKTTPLSLLKLAEIFQEADVPPGVFNVVTGTGATGDLMIKHDEVDKIAFTGSTQIGRLIHKAAAGTRKKVTLELGGKGANIIFEDAPLQEAVEGIINAIFLNQGHVCCAGSRLFVQESVADEVLLRLKNRMETLIVGDPLDKNSDVGAINNKPQLEEINRFIDIGKKEGALLHQNSAKLPKRGYWCRPSIFTGVTQSSTIAREEIFGPVLAIQTFRTVDEVIQKANNTPYGLGTGVWTDKGSKIFNLTTKLRNGVVWANTYNKFDPTSPFGGYKESGYGRVSGITGLHANVKF